MSLTDERTTNYALPLPHPANEGADDCLRLRQALAGVDAALKSVADVADTKADVSALESKADAADIASGIATALEGVDANLALKADISALAQKAEVSALDAKADVSALGVKADVATVNAALALKADTATVSTHSVDPAAHGLDVTVAGLNAELAKKSNAATVTAALATKADTAIINTALAEKADVSALASKADKTTVDTALAKNTADHEGFDTALAGKAEVEVVTGLAARVDELVENGNSKLVLRPTIEVPEKLPINARVPVTVRSASALAGVPITTFLVRVGDREPAEIPAVSNRAIYEVAAYGVVDELFTLGAQAKDGAGNLSEWNYIEKPLGIAVVNAPEIMYPAENANVLIAGLTVIPSSFSASFNAIDTHISSDYKITSDDAGNTILSQKLESAHIAAHTFTNLSIADGSVNYLWAAHTGERIGKSEWSLPRKIIARNKITTPGGRMLSRHSSNTGTIMEFNDGQPRKVLVLDAQYREVKKWGTEGYDPTSLQNYGETPHLTSGAVMTDTEMNSNFSKSIDANTARQNCDTWMTRNSVTDTGGILGVPAVAYARSIVVNGKVCDIPNIQTLKRIFLEADNIDALDPTVAAHRGKALGNMNSNGFWRVLGGDDGAWVSTKYNGMWMRHIKPGGDCGWMYKTYNLAVIPVLEL